MNEILPKGRRCFVIGDEPLAAQCADIARHAGLEVVAMASTHPSVLEYGNSIGVPTFPSDGDLVASLRDVSFDILLSIANLRLLDGDLLRRADVAVNFHDGPLPDYIGLNVTSWALLDRVREHAVTWHLMTDEVDAGEIVTSESFAVAADDTAFALNARCYEAALASFPRVASALASGSVTTKAQPDRHGRTFRRRDRPQRVIDLSTTTATDVARFARALDLGILSTNAIGVPILLVGGVGHTITSADISPVDTIGAEPPAGIAGQIVSADERTLRVWTSDGAVDLELATLDGTRVEPRSMLSSAGFGVGSLLTSPDPALVTAFGEFDAGAAGDESFWRRRLRDVPPSRPALSPPEDADSSGATWGSTELATSKLEPSDVVARTSLWLARSAGSDCAVFDFTDRAVSTSLDALGSLARPLRAIIEIDDDATVDELHRSAEAELEAIRRHGPFAADLVGRDPSIDAEAAAAVVRVDIDPTTRSDADTGATAVIVEISTSARTAEFRWHRALVDERVGRRLAEQLDAVLAVDDADLVGHLEILTAVENDLVGALDDTLVTRDEAVTVDGDIWKQAAATPAAAAVSFAGTTSTYGELIDASERFAERLCLAGVGRGHLVGVALPRGIDMVVGVLATLRIGAAYVPLDPSYPHDRLEHMVDDAGLTALLAHDPLGTSLARDGVVTLDPADDSPVVPPEPTDAPVTASPAHGAPERDAPQHDVPRHDAPHHDAHDLAYVIYTSGSTGTPKGVMLGHDNVANFFTAMDDVIDHDQPGVWLAVTSLSFDISVLELLWTLARGFHVVIKPESGFRGAADDDGPDTAAPSATMQAASDLAKTSRDVAMSLFYFAAAEDDQGDKYRLLLDGARFADTHGFQAVWTPERHFHAFGGAYPNPSVVSAAIAAVTDRIAIRAGSVVLPLHSPVRVAEEWSVVDNISSGRVGISFAPGWQPDDFVLNPSRYGRARAELPGLIETVHRLWQGETVELDGHDGEPVAVSTLPRPIQPTLPTWLTSAGTPATFEQAGQLGANVLTHLLGQTPTELAANIDRYRQARSDAGHEGNGHVTLMLHTHLDEDPTVARERAREPMKSYLSTAVGLIKNMASSFPTFAGSGKDADEAFESLTADELDQLLEMAAARYLDASGLFGTPEQAAATITEMSRLGVDEVACLIDFGLDTDDVISSFPLLARTRELIDARRAGDDEPATSPPARTSSDDSMAALVAEHRVTHLQCTPSLAAMLSADPADRAALGSVSHLMVGGEALPVGLAADLSELLSGRFTNMYGPTETTIWSLVHEIEGVEGASIPIGRPIANTSIAVLDEFGHRRPVGAFGELHIGGQGVARGYHERDELTADRFVDRGAVGRMYATGDIVRIREDGLVEFAGRSDNQLKIRGHRIELGEIETVLDQHPWVVQSAVLARGEAGDPTLVAFLITESGRDIETDALRHHVAEVLPAVMVPTTFVAVPVFPLTPNGKVDRNAFPAHVAPTRRDHNEVVSGADDGERLIVEVWEHALGRTVGRDDNFFEIGGHSLLAVGVFRTLTERTGAPLALTDLFRYPTVRTLARHLADGSAADRFENGSESGNAAPGDARDTTAGSARGERRRRAMARRGGRTTT